MTNNNLTLYYTDITGCYMRLCSWEIVEQPHKKLCRNIATAGN